jgi:hypothetical protein
LLYIGGYSESSTRLPAWKIESGKKKKEWAFNIPKLQLLASVTATVGDLVLAGGTNDRMFHADSCFTLGARSQGPSSRSLAGPLLG